ncbi:MAG: GAF domain-containing protein [Solirubrobacterales bacterium]|nr:GAF domain-containing protein [Solirubrobacterales bacterium]
MSPDEHAAPSHGLPGWDHLGLGEDPARARARALLERDESAGADALRSSLSELFELRLREVEAALDRAEDRAGLASLREAAEAKALEEQLAEGDRDRRLTALVDVQEALSGMRRSGSVDAILQTAPRELSRACGFDRANLFKVEDGRMVMESAYWEGDSAGAQEMLVWARENPPRLDHMMLETEMIRRRAPCLVLDARNDPRVPRALADFARTRSYVAAPIMPAGKVIGFVHADRLYSGRICDAVDRDLVWAFAEGFGYAFERTVMAERLRQQRDQARTALLSTLDMMDAATEEELRLTQAETGSAVSSRRAVGRLLDESVPMEAALTPREVEVVRFLATGMTNQAIAEELVVTVGTVKSHVKHILRKFHAANRAEAVSRYLRSARTRELQAMEAAEA